MWETIERLLKERGLTKNKLATLAGINKNSLIDLKMGRKKSLKFEDVVKIADVLDVSLDEFRMEVNLNAGQILYYTDQAALKRVLNGYPTQFIKFGIGTQSTDNAFRLIGAGSSSSVGASIASFGTNRNNGENNLDGGFTGVNIYSGGTTGTNVVDRIELASDILQIAHAASTGIANDPRGWTFENQNSVNNNYVFRPNTSPNSAYKALIGTSVTPINELYIDEAYIKGQRLGWILKDIANRIGHGGWANYIS